MPVSVVSLLAMADLNIESKFQWGAQPAADFSGIYIVALSPVAESVKTLPKAPVSRVALDSWLQVRPGLNVGLEAATPDLLLTYLESLWLPDETILYIGQTGRTITRRIKEFYRHTVGKKSPHAGGQIIKTLTCLNQLTVYAVRSEQPKTEEEKLLYLFRSKSVATHLLASQMVMGPPPFANLI